MIIDNKLMINEKRQVSATEDAFYSKEHDKPIMSVFNISFDRNF